MSTIFIILNLFTFLLIHIHASPSNNWDPSKFKYPEARRANDSFEYGSLLPNGTIINVTVADPYNWLEQDVDKSNETKAFVDAEVALTQTYLDQNKDLDKIRRSVSHLNDYVPIGGFDSFGPDDDKKYFYSVLEVNASRRTTYLVTSEELKKGFEDQFSSYPGQKWFDDNLLSKDGSSSSLGFLGSPDGNLVVYLVDAGGGDVATLYLRNITSPFIQLNGDPISGGEGKLSDEIPHFSGGGVFWNSDSTGFTYSQQIRNVTGGFGSRILYHQIGTNVEDDIVIVDYPQDPFSYWSHLMTPDKKWILVMLNKGVDFKNAVYVTSLENQTISNNMTWQSISPDYKWILYPLANINSTFFFASDVDQALNGKVVSVEVDKSKARHVQHLTELTERLEFNTLIPEKSDAKLEIFDLEELGINPSFDTDKLFIYYTKNATQEKYVFDLNTGKELAQVLPDVPLTIYQLNTDNLNNEFFVFADWIDNPETIYRLSWNNTGEGQLETKVIYKAKVEGVDFDKIVTEQRFSISKDGTKVPFTLFYQNTSQFDGTMSAILYSYGSYGINSLPGYSERLLDWILGYNGAVIIAYPRGGGENGAQWHIDGMLEKHQNTVDDVISIAENLVEDKIVGFGKIVVNGASAGGTLCMVTVNQAREGLLGGAVCDRGLYDMLRYTTMQISGPANTVEFGDPNNASDFSWLSKFSPLQNVNSTKVYPFVLLYATANDDRVAPGNSYKMIAELQHDLQNNTNPLLLYVQLGQGHRSALFSRKSFVDSVVAKAGIIAEGLGLNRSD